LKSLASALEVLAVSLVAASAGGLTGMRSALRLAFRLRYFHFLIPIPGWDARAGVESVIAALDHWVAAALLAFIAGAGETRRLDPRRGLTLAAVSIASSFDALAAGLSLAMLQDTTLLHSVVIGLTTGCMSVAGILLGARLSKGFSRRAEVAGGIVMLLFALRILLDPLAPHSS